MRLLSIVDLDFCETGFSEKKKVEGGYAPGLSMAFYANLSLAAKQAFMAALGVIPAPASPGGISGNQDDQGNTVMTSQNYNQSSSSGTTVHNSN